jgi:two-component system, LytTR family, response regulator
MKVVIIDDEPLARSIVKEYLEPHTDLEVVEECDNGLQGLKAIQQHKPDLIFLDVQMPRINGFEMLELVEESPAVIFTTAFDEYALKAFDAHAVDYLLKPFTQERFDKALKKWKESSAAAATTAALLESAAIASPVQSSRIVVKVGSHIKIIPVHEINFIEAADDYAKVYTKEGSFLKSGTMSHYEAILNKEQFVRCHRSHIVNVQYITRIDPYEKDSHVAVLKSGEKIPVSRAGYARLKQVLGL